MFSPGIVLTLASALEQCLNCNIRLRCSWQRPWNPMRKMLRTGRLKFEVYSQRQSINQYAPTVVIRLIIHNVQKMVIERAPTSLETRMMVIVFFLFSMVLFFLFMLRGQNVMRQGLCRPTFLQVWKIGTQRRQYIVRSQKRFFFFSSPLSLRYRLFPQYGTYQDTQSQESNYDKISKELDRTRQRICRDVSIAMRTKTFWFTFQRCIETRNAEWRESRWMTLSDAEWHKMTS